MNAKKRQQQTSLIQLSHIKCLNIIKIPLSSFIFAYSLHKMFCLWCALEPHTYHMTQILCMNIGKYASCQIIGIYTEYLIAIYHHGGI